MSGERRDKDDSSRWEVPHYSHPEKERLGREPGGEDSYERPIAARAPRRSSLEEEIANRFHGERAKCSGPQGAGTMRRPPGVVQWTSSLILLILATTVHATSTKQPHIIFILADDLASLPNDKFCRASKIMNC